MLEDDYVHGKKKKVKWDICGEKGLEGWSMKEEDQNR